MSEALQNIAEVLIPLPIKGPFQYLIPDRFQGQIQIGMRVIVQFGQKKFYTGIIKAIGSEIETAKNLKSILELIDESPVVRTQQLKFFDWMAEYYMCNTGDVIRAALPAGLKISSETRIEISDPHWEDRNAELTEAEVIMLSLLEGKKHMTIAEAGETLGLKQPQQALRHLADMGFILFFEDVQEQYKPKWLRKVRLADTYLKSETLEALFSDLDKKQKQLEVILIYLRQLPILKSPESNEEGMAVNDLVEQGASRSSINTLLKNGVFTVFNERQSRFEKIPTGEQKIELSDMQQKAQSEIFKAWENDTPVLLHGITGSGKTEVYISLIQQCLENGQEALLLLPEIALTTQIVNRLRKVFGDEMGVYHSRFSDHERVEIWENLLQKRYKFIVGVRSAVFLPFDSLGLIIVDEEHDSSYKQQDPTPRYHARDAAIVLAKFHHAKILMGSATPALETYFLANSGKWAKVEMLQRFHDAARLPKIEVQNFLEARKKGLTRSIFTTMVLQAIESQIKAKKQVIIFQNRRGYAPFLQCQSCAYVPMCHQCDVSLTLHQYAGELRCHYCGFHEHIPSSCPKCGSTEIKTMGTGTEKIEEEIGIFFPEARLQRMDLDSTRSKNAFQNILNSFEKGEVDILIGTQMVTKGLDFSDVELVVVLGADQMLYFPDFRSGERVYSLLTQVAGRAGRISDKGQVVIQSNMPSNPIFQLVLQHDYKAFYKFELAERQAFKYPPFTRMIRIVMKSRDAYTLEVDAQTLADDLKKHLGFKRILGPEKPPVSRIRNLYIREIFLKYERDTVNPTAFKSLLQTRIQAFQKKSTAPNLRLTIDVDAM